MRRHADRVAGAPRPGREPIARRIRGGATAAAICTVAGAALWWMSRGAARPAHVRGSPYVANTACVECHEAEATAWRRSHHARAMAPASPASVHADFGGIEFVRDGVTTRFLQRDGKLTVRTEGPDGRIGDFEVAYAIGVEPLQQYLLGLPGGRLQAFTLAWDTRHARWFDLLPGETHAPGDLLHWTGRYQTWNTMCAACHATNLVKGYDADADVFRSAWSETAVTCQSCHGPGRRHVIRVRANAGGDDGLVPIARSAAHEVDTCAPCHARRAEIVAVPVPGAPLYDDFVPSLLEEGLYSADGQQLGEVYEYGSFRQSRMYQAGVRCTDCHDPHAARLRADGSALCLRCHHLTPDRQRFPGLVARSYDSPAHHFHRVGSPGAQCVACHMPARTYMLVDVRRDHAIRIPRPDLTVRIGTPNACTTCHADRAPQWAADAVARWYGPGRRQGRHYGEAIAAARSGQPGAEAELDALVLDATQPAIVRATAVALLGRSHGAPPGTLAAAAHDDAPAVRLAAAASLEGVPDAQRIVFGTPLLSDPRRAVRAEAARGLSAVARDLDRGPRRAYERARAEFEAAQAVSLDLPGAHLNLAVVREREGDPARAEDESRAALRLDRAFTPASLNLSRLLSGLGRAADAEGILRDALARAPAEGALHYSLGLLLAETGRLAEAAALLGRAADLLPQHARAHYNHALAIQRLGRRDEAEQEFARAVALDPYDPDLSYAAAVFYAQQQDWERALGLADRAASLAPEDTDLQASVTELRRAARAAASPAGTGSR